MEVTENLLPALLDLHSAAARNSPPVLEFKVTRGTASVYHAAADIPAEVWQRALSGRSKDYRYYEISEETLPGQFEHAYLVLRDPIGFRMAVQPVFIAQQDILEGLPRRVHSALAWPRHYFPRWLRMSMLVAGCTTGNGDLDCSQPWAVEMLREALMVYARKRRVAMVLLKDFPSSYRGHLRPFEEHGYRRVPSMPGCAIDFDFANFEEFHRKRLGRSLRYKFNKIARQPAVPMEVLTDVTPMADEIHALYMQTYERSKMRFECLTPEFFARIGREMPETARFFLWRVDGHLAAFALCLVHEDTMNHLNIGFDYAVSLKLQLYYTTVKDLFEWSLAQGLQRYYTGQLNYDPKLHLRMKLVPLDLYSRHTSALVNPLYKLALGFLQPVRHDPLIRQFPNANEL